MFKQSKLMKILSVGILAIPISLTATSCSDYGSLTSVSNTTNDYPTTSDSKVGTIPASLANLNSNAPSSFTYLSANSYGLKENYTEFGDNNDLSSYTGKSVEMKSDISYYAYLLWVQNSKAFSITSVNVDNYSIQNLTDSAVVFDQTTISFDLTIEITGIQSTSITLLNQTFSLVANNSYTLKIAVDNQTVKSTVNSSSDVYFLGWKVANASVTFDGSSFTAEFAPTTGGFSFAFPYKVNNLTDKQNYLQLYSQYQSSILDISSSDLKTQIATKFNNNYETTLDYIDNGIGIIGVLQTNPTIEDLIKGVIPYVTKILVLANIIPSYLSPLIDDAFAAGNESKSFVEIIQEYESEFIEYLESYFGSVASIVEPYLDLFKPGLTSDSSDYKSLKNLFDELGLSQEIQDLIFNDVLGVDGQTPKTLLDIIYDNTDLILSWIDPTYSFSSTSDSTSSDSDTSSSTSSSDSSLSQTDAIINLVELILSKNTTTNEYNTFFDLLSGDEKTEFYNDIIAMLGGTSSELTDILSLITESNDNFTTDNLITFISALYDFLSTLFARSEDYTNFYTSGAFQNITFYTNFTKDPVIDKTNQTITFSYQIYFVVNKKIDASPVVAAFKNLLSDDTISSLIKEFTGTDLDTIIGNIPLVGDFAKERVIAALLEIIPTNLWIGADSGDTYYQENEYSTTYSADASSIWLYPVADSTNYELGYQFEYDTDIRVDDPSLINSITSNYNYTTNSISLLNISLGNEADWTYSEDIVVDFYYYDFWKSLLQNAILRDYSYTSVYKSDAINDDQVIATTSTYSPDLYITGLEITNTTSSIDASSLATTFSPTDSDYTQTVNSSYVIGNLYEWKDGSGAGSMPGIKPVVTQDLLDTITSEMYSYDADSVNTILANTNLKLATSVDALLNFNLPLKIYQADYDVNVDFNIRIMMLNLNMYIPVKVYDTTSKSLINNISDTIFYINATDASTSS